MAAMTAFENPGSDDPGDATGCPVPAQESAFA